MGKTLVSLVLAIVFSISSAISQEKRLLNYSIVGSASSDKSPSYGKAMERIEVQRLLLELAASPRSVAFMDSTLSGSTVSRGDLEELRLIKRDGDTCKLNFTLFTVADVRRVREVSEHFSQSLADAFLGRRTEIDSLLATYSVPSVDPKAVAFIVLGCVSLDWDGLEITADEHYRLTASDRPDGNYVPYAEERSSLSREKIYWGSHNEDVGNVKITSFGDHHSLPRNAFPDFLWSLDESKADNGLPAILRQSARGAKIETDSAVRQLGGIIFTLRDSRCTADELARLAGVSSDDIKEWLALLSRMEYITETSGRYRTRIPVLTERDRPMIQKLRDIGHETIRAWLKTNYEQIKHELSGTTPERNGVQFSEGFTMIWHFIFGITNRKLVEAGLFADPYGASRKYKGFIPAVFDTNSL